MMSVLDSVPMSATDDAAAIADLHRAFAAQRAAFAADRSPTIEQRRESLIALIGMMVGNRERISAAIACDFGAHPAPASDLIEVLGVVGRAQYVLEHLEEWMAPMPRDTDSALLGSARAYVQYQPKGVRPARR